MSQITIRALREAVDRAIADHYGSGEEVTAQSALAALIVSGLLPFFRPPANAREKQLEAALQESSGLLAYMNEAFGNLFGPDLRERMIKTHTDNRSALGNMPAVLPSASEREKELEDAGERLRQELSEYGSRLTPTLKSSAKEALQAWDLVRLKPKSATPPVSEETR